MHVTFLMLGWTSAHATGMEVAAGHCDCESASEFLLVQGWAGIQAPH